MKTRYAMQIAYEGTDFCGWQRQLGVGRHHQAKPSIEGALREAFRGIRHEDVVLTSSGRTDAGVHASGQVAHFHLPERLPSERLEHLRLGLMARLPSSIQIVRMGCVPLTFHAKKSVQKQYSFYFQQGPADLPQLQAFSVWSRRPLDAVAMDLAVRRLIGRHDFAAFCGGGSQLSSSVREIFEAEVTREPIPFPGSQEPGVQSLIRIRLLGSGFLKQMARRIAGALRQIGEGRSDTETLVNQLQGRTPDASCRPGPARGLWLDRVWYPRQEGIAFLHQT